MVKMWPAVSEEFGNRQTDILPQATSRTRICRNLCRFFFGPQATCRIPKNSLFFKKIVAFKKVLMDWSCRPSLGPRICRTYWKYKSWGSIIVLQTQKTYLFEDCTVILVHFALSLTLLTSSCWSPWSMIRYAIFSPITITMIVIHGHKHQVINI